MSETNWPPGGNPLAFTAATWFAQTFSPLWTHTIEQCRFLLRAITPWSIAKIALQYLLPDGTPSGGDLFSFTIHASQLQPFGSLDFAESKVPPIEIIEGINYCWVIGLPISDVFGIMDTIYMPLPSTYPRGKLIRSINSGLTWDTTDRGDLIFAEWGNPPKAPNPYIPPPEDVAIQSVSQTSYLTSACTKAFTTSPAKLRCLVTELQPVPIQHPITRRGTTILCLDYYSFSGYRTYFQLESWDSLIHTFHIKDLKKDRTYWFTFEGDANFDPARIAAPIFKRIHPEAPPFTTIRRPDAPGAVCNIPHQRGDPCPNHWKNVDDATPDENTTTVYNRTSFSSYRRDLYNIPDLDPLDTAPIEQVHITARFKRTPAMPHIAAYVNIRLKTHATEYNSPLSTTQATWKNFHYHSYLNPFTGLRWTQQEVNDLQIGIRLQRRQGVGWGITTFCTQVYCKIIHLCNAEQ